MNFKQATDVLGDYVTHQRIAAECSVSVQTIRQARLDKENSNHRSPPRTWSRVIARLARQRAKELERLATDLKGGEEGAR